MQYFLTIEPCLIIDPDNGSVTTESSCRTNPSGRILIQIRFDLNTGLGELKLHSDDIANCTAGDNHYVPDIYYVIGSTIDPQIHPDPPLTLTRTESEKEFEKHWSWDMQYNNVGAFTGCPTLCKIDMTISSKPPEETKISISGCTDLMIGYESQITAEGKPPGGTYSWQSEPASLYNISGSGSTVTISGNSPGRGHISVEYTPKKGNKMKAKLSGAVVELLSVNGGAAIPPIGLYDENGNKKLATMQIPTQQDPPGGDLLQFPVADPGVATVVNTGSGLQIQGLKEGKTSTRAQTRCGNRDEYSYAIEVVNCDEETKQKLRDKLKEIDEQIAQTRDQLNSIHNDREFIRAKKDIDRHMTKMSAKALGIFISAAGAEGSGGVLDHVSEIVQQLHDVTEEGSWTGNWSLVDMYIKLQVNTVKKFTIGIINDLIEYGEAGLEVGHDLDVIKATVESLKEPLQRLKDLYKDRKEVVGRQFDLCKDYGEPQQPEPKPPEPEPPTHPPTEPKPPTPPPQPPPQPPPAEPQPPEPTEPIEPTEPEPPGPGDDVIVEPPLPPSTPPPSGGGFPIDCGCARWNQNQWSGTPEGMRNMGNDLGSVFPCLDQFMQNTGRPLESASRSVMSLFERFEQASALPDSQKGEVYRAAMPEMLELRDKHIQYGLEFKSMSDSLSQCNQATKKAVEIIGTAGQ